ncbi:MAG TPA: glycosyltransferase family 39 protein, partial [Polyangiaceae bacterium]
YQKGSFYTYPPVHLLLLTVLTLPVWLTGVLRAPSLAPDAVIGELTKVSYMTAFSLVARLASVAMSLGIVLGIFLIGREVWGRRTGIAAAVVVSTNVIFNYYSHTSNLDVPYLFWAIFALLALTRAIQRREPRRLRTFAALAALSVCTKDQAFALFLFAAPLLLLLWVATDADLRARWRELLRESALAAVIAASMVLVIDGALLNPSGFRARIHFLTGPASQGHAVYERSFAGVVAVLLDTLRFFDRYYPILFLLLAASGILVALRRPAQQKIAALVPLAAMASFTLAFNCSAGRTEHRFLLPQMLLVALYVGLGWEAFLSIRDPRVWRPLSAALLIWALYRCASVDASLLDDPRYQAEAWMQTEMRPGDSVETYGNDAYLPRFPEGIEVARVGPQSLGGRSRVPGIREVQGEYADAEQRRPRYIVVSEGWAWRYLTEPVASPRFGTVLAPEQAARETDERTRTFFRRLVNDSPEYHVALVARRASGFWLPVDIHSSTDKPIWILRRADL